MRKGLLIPMCLAIVLFIMGCTKNDTETAQKVDFQGSYKVYHNFEELYEEADVVAEVTILGQSTEVLHDMPITTSTAEVNDVLKGKLTNKEIVSINELGGVYFPHLYGDESRPTAEQAYELTFNGVGTMKPDERHIVFLVLDDERNDGSYTVYAMYQGKFKIKGSKVDRGIDEDEELQSFKFKSVDELKEKLRDMNKR